MVEIKPTKKQEELINSREGIYIVDAGPGTGKTFTITKRYLQLLKDGKLEPKNILLLTFTENAAEQMKKKIMNSYGKNSATLQYAPISTFHSFCKKILDLHGFDAPMNLGINDEIGLTTKILENETLEIQHFQEFFYNFINNHPEYNAFYPIVYKPAELLALIKNLCAKGIFPTKKGWYQNSDKYLKGDFTQFKRFFDNINTSLGGTQSKLRTLLNSFGINKCYLVDAPTKDQIRGASSTKIINEKYAKDAFNEDREDLIKFIHDIYFFYIEYALSRNYYNFSFLVMFAYLLLCEDNKLRKDLQFEFVMVDEFQDTNEIQFKLILLLSKNGNIFVVGDWKQSIFSFQYATIENIRHFKERLAIFSDELNSDLKRVEYSVDKVIFKNLDENHRSSQKIIDISEKTLIMAATDDDVIDINAIQKEITHINAVRTCIDSKVEKITSINEKEAIISKIQEIIKNTEYQIEDEYNEIRSPNYGDIVILTRTSKFGIELEQVAKRYGIPISYEAGIELFKTDPAILILAWLRILNDVKSQKGWVVILEEAGYFIDEIKYILASHHYPANMIAFREELLNAKELKNIVSKIFQKYGINNAYSDKILEVLQKIFKSAFMNIGDLIQFILNNIDNGITYVIDSGIQKNVIIIQTIHAAKGLEYPIVFVSDINNGHFPSKKSDTKTIIYDDTIGLRQKRIYTETPRPNMYDNWKTEILTKTIGKDYDEERRLYYVALTRAKDHLILTSQKENFSRFFTGLGGIEIVELKPDLKKLEEINKEKKNILEIEAAKKNAPIKLSVHAIMEKISGTEGEGTEYGTKIHVFAEKYAKRESIEPKNQDEENVKKFIDGLQGKLITEEACLLPLRFEDDVKRTIILSGIIDLIYIVDDNVQIIDYKTDRNKIGKTEYTKQLSVYYHILKEVFLEKSVSVYLFYTYMNELCEIEPLSLDFLKKIILQKLK